MSASTAQALAHGPEDTANQTNGRSKEDRWKPVLGLPCELTVDLPVPAFKLGDFLGLHAGSLINTGWGVARDVPVRVNGTLIGWGEMESTGSRLAVRLTELA